MPNKCCVSTEWTLRHGVLRWVVTRVVTEIFFHWIQILCSKSVGFGCGFAMRSQLVSLNSYLSMSAYSKHQIGRHILVPFGILTYNDRTVTHLRIRWGVALGPIVVGAGTRHLPPSQIHAPVTNRH